MLKRSLYTIVPALIFSCTVLAASDIQSHESIGAAVKTYIAEHINLPGEYEVDLIPLDNRLALPLCEQAIEAYTPTGMIKAGRMTIGVRCNGKRRWSIFTSAVIRTFQDIVVLSRPVRRGEILTRQFLTLERREVTHLREDFATEIEQVENKQITRSLDRGTVLSIRNLVQPKIIHRGDKVMITSTNSDFSVKMSGVAMRDGVKGQMIRVKNQSSGRIINAIAVRPGIVAVKR